MPNGPNERSVRGIVVVLSNGTVPKAGCQEHAIRIERHMEAMEGEDGGLSGSMR